LRLNMIINMTAMAPPMEWPCSSRQGMRRSTQNSSNVSC
jgi:hypothetical protein